MSQRRAVVTGGSEGIGLECARRLGQNGRRVVLVARRKDRLEAAAKELGDEGITVETLNCDVSDEAAVNELFEQIGDLDILVASAGTSSAAPVTATTLEDWNRNLAVNATSTFLCVRAVVPTMLGRNWGRIVVIASTAAVMGMPRLAAYSASKHAAVGLVRAVAAEVAGSGVTVNAVCPTYVRTPMTDRTLTAIAARIDGSRDEALAALVGRTPLGRLIEPEEVAAAVDLLTAEESAPINGEVLVMDGGGGPRHG